MEQVRTEEDKIFGTPIKITLGGVDYDVAPLKIKAGKVWRDKYFAPLVKAAGETLGAFQSAMAVGRNVDLTDFMGAAQWLATSALDEAFDAVINYSPVLAADKARIEDEAYEIEIVSALASVVKLAFPLGKAMEMIGATTTTATPAPSPTPAQV